MTGKAPEDSKEDFARISRARSALSAMKSAASKYTKAVFAFSDASLQLSNTMHAAYPPTGPLDPALAMATNRAAYEPGTTESGKVQEILLIVVQQLDGVLVALKEDVKRRTYLANEMTHYQEKLGKLQVDPKKQGKVAQNRAKLNTITEEHQQLARSCHERLQALDNTIREAMHTPFTNILQWQARLTGGIAKCYNSAAVSGSASPRPTSPRPPVATLVPGGAGAPASVPVTRATEAAASPHHTPRSSGGSASPHKAAASAANGTSNGALVPQPAPGEGVTVMQAIRDYTPTSDAEIALKAGDIFLRTSETGDFSFGRIGDAFGEYQSSAAVPFGSVRPKFSVQAIFTYTTDDHTELVFNEGDTLQVVTDTDEGWWLGVNAGRIGYLPCNYVATK